jgi:predicted secreted Zn-dependent protease
MCLGFLSTGYAQTVSIINKKFVVNGNAGCPIYFNGANTPWDNWNDFGGNYDAGFWSTHFATLKANGINASRVWISCNGDVQPNINTDGTVTGASTQFWQNLDHFFQAAQSNGIYIMATMMSFDHTKNTYTKYQSWRNMLNDPAKVQTYCDNYLVPFVNKYKSNPYLMSIDISNEIEWVAEDNNNMKCSYAVLQRFVAMCASAIHNNPRTDGTSVLVTMGSAATKWNATKMRAGFNGAWSQNNSDGNKWSDAALKAQYNQANAVLDFYSPHYYAWVDEWYSNPYVRTPADFGMDDKAVLIGETPAGNPGTPDLSVLASYEALKNNGYHGHFPWTSNGVDTHGDISKFGTDAKTFSTTYNSLVYPACAVVCATVAPTVTTPVTYCLNAAPSALTASGTALKWYADNTTTTALASAPLPSTSTAGTTNYYVSQTLNGCEGPRALIAVTVHALPTAVITTTTPTTFCAGGSVTLTASGGTSYQWNNASGPINGATGATYAAAASGSYTVKVTNANSCSATSSTATVVTVNPLPSATITTTTPTTFCAGGSVTLTASGGTSYQWNNASGPINGATGATYPAATSGSYTVKVTNANNCSATTSTATVVTVNPLPSATITTTTPTTFCAGGSVTLTASGGTSYQWNNASGPINGATGATYPAATSGSYTVKVTNANSCSATTSTATVVTVNSLPSATITTTTPTTFCAGGSVTLTASGGTSYQWSNASGPINGATGATYPAAASGSYTVKVTNANNCSATTSTATVVTVNPLPSATITTTTPTTFCAGGSVTLTASGGASYQWNNASGPINGATGATYPAAASGSYTVKVTNANNCSATTSTATVVTVSSAVTWYQDLDGDGKGDAAVTQTSCTQPAGYVAMAGDACPSDPDKTEPGVCGCGVAEGNCTTTDVVDLTSTDAIKIMPNPSTHQFKLVLAESAMVYISTADGRLVEVFPDVRDISFGAEYAKGVYVVQIMNVSATQVIRVIKQ